MPVKYLDWIERTDLQANPDEFFVFGDNAIRVGLGGQAKAMRGEPNAIGVATLYEPGKFYDPADPICIAVVASDLAQVARHLGYGKIVNVPRDGLGTGLACLPEHAPAIANLITSFFRACPGEPCPWEFV